MKSETIESIEILTACFSISFLYGGAIRLVAVFYVESIQLYEINRKQASFPYVLAFLVRNLCGPLQGYLEQIFGMKFLVIFGNIVTTISIGICFFAENILTITILWGVIFGFCFGLGTQYLPSLIDVHFTTNRSKAIGFVFTGACFGGVMMPPIIEACIENYGLNGSFLILSSIMAHLIPFSFLLKSQDGESKCGFQYRKAKVKQSRTEIKETVSSLLNIDEKLRDTSLQAKDTEAGATNLRSTDLNQTFASEIFPPTEPANQKSSKRLKKKVPSVFSLQNFKIFLDLSFITMLVMTAGNTFVLTTMWTIILDFVRDKNVGENLEIYYVMIMPLADIFGRMGSGYVVDKKFLPTAVFTSICCVCAGLTLLGLLFTHHYLILMFFSFFFTIFHGAILILQIALIYEFMQLEKRIMAMSSRFMLYAPLNLAISPMIGYFRGKHGYYDGVIYCLTSVSFFCGFIIHLVPLLEKRGRSAPSDNIA